MGWWSALHKKLATGAPEAAPEPSKIVAPFEGIVLLAVPVLKRYDLLDKLVRSCENGTRRPDHYFIVDNGGRIDDEIRSGRLWLPENATVHNPGRNLGVAASWNLALQHGSVLISNDDVEMGRDTIEKIVRAAGDPTSLMVQISDWSLFYQKKELTEMIGTYDEGFYPAYFEDNDYHWRMQIAKIDRTLVSAHYFHHTSATSKAGTSEEQEAQREAFRFCKARYIEKWGGRPGEEARLTPRSCDHFTLDFARRTGRV